MNQPAARVLIVEDQDKIRVLLAEALTQDGYRVTEHSTSVSALADLDSGNDVGAVILDWILAGAPAEEVFHRIMTHPARHGCVITSGYRLGPPDMADGLEKRVIFVEKPFTPGMIRDALARLGVVL